jgi:carnitine-CoA ligase
MDERPPGDEPTLAAALRRRAADTPHEVFIVAEAVAGDVRSVTFAGLAARAGRLARLLRSMGIGHGSRFHVHLPNCAEFAECLFAGAVLLHDVGPGDRRLPCPG